MDGDQTVVNTATLSVEDTFIELARNNSGTTLDAGIYINRGTAGNNAAFYWDASEVSFKAATVTDDAGTSPITSATLANIRVAEPSNNSDATTKFYVDNIVGGAGFSIFFSGDDSASITASPGTTVYFSGGNNIVTSATEEPDQININLRQNLTDINSISNGSTNGDLILTANGSGSVIVNNILTFGSNASTPAAASVTKLYSKAPSGGGTGVFFINSAVTSGEDELISKKKATALAIALG